MTELRRRLDWARERGDDAERALTREWLVTNGLGGYASGTVAGAATRRYHGLLVAALPAPLGRVMLLNHVWERVRLPDRSAFALGEQEGPGGPLATTDALREFHLELGLPVWRYSIGGFLLEKRLMLPYAQNTVHVIYRLLEGPGRLRLIVRPSVHFRPHNAPVSEAIPSPYTLTATASRYELSAGSEFPPLRLTHRGPSAAFTLESRAVRDVPYVLEGRRGYEATGTLWSPGYFRFDLDPETRAAVTASTESWEALSALAPEAALSAENERRTRLLDAADPRARCGVGAELVLAADQFIIAPAGRIEDAARARAAGDEIRSVIAGYHWFTDWGRDTMISLEGLALVTGRHVEAGYVLRAFARSVRDGLIPNLFPEGDREGLYHTADATLWFFHAIDRYVDVTQDRATLRWLLPILGDIVEHHLEGTRFGIGVDDGDGLLRQGAPGYQLTWMDAKVGEWVVTPRRGKAVEINALWYNALRLMEEWTRDEVGAGSEASVSKHAQRVHASFNKRFWYDAGGFLYDVVDGEEGNDPRCRPNQIVALSLRYPVLDASRWERVLEVVAQRLLTPVGLRSLAPGEPDYRARYDGDLRARDAAYHQGTVWAWLLGPFVDAWLRVHPGDHESVGRFLAGCFDHLSEACVGSVGEIFDAEPPFTPRGCVAQAWSVAEVLRCWVRSAPSA
jgi:predicted glycogen debranching enzyme